MNKGFLNPYNFIPFPNQKSKKYNDKDCHSGVIEFQITTKTPLFIPNTSNDNAFQKTMTEIDPKTGEKKEVKLDSYDFFSYCELPKKDKNEKDINYEDEKNCKEPVIPGSEIRGMVRNIYETLTDSCVGVLNANDYPVKRTSEAFQPALIHRNGKDFSLYKAVKYYYKKPGDQKTFKDNSYNEGQKLYFKYEQRGRKFIVTDVIKDIANIKKDGIKEGYLIKGMDSPSGNKRDARLFVASGKEPVYSLSEKDLDRLDTVLQSYQDQPGAEDSYCKYKEAFKKFRKGEGENYFPVYYSEVEDYFDKGRDYLYLAPACYTKELSNNSIGDLVGSFKPCEKRETCCPACDLFGMKGNSNTEAVASGIRFSDAHIQLTDDEDDYRKYFDPVVTLESLGGPKLGNVEFYLERPVDDHGNKADFWTYDYYICNGEIHIQNGKLRGRKYYWHQPGVKLPRNINETKTNKTVRPLKEGVTFIGEMYYDNISDRQLNQLLWILDCGRPDVNNGLAFKLGMGKPLGLGSVELKVISKTDRVIEATGDGIKYVINTTSGSDLHIPQYNSLGFDRKCKNDFMTICSFHATDGMYISYPVTQEQVGKPMEEGYKWFVEDTTIYKTDDDGDILKDKNGKDCTIIINSRKKMKISYELPSLMDYQKNLLPFDARRGVASKNKTKTSSIRDIVGTIVDYNTKGTALKVEIEGGKRVNLYLNAIQTKEDVDIDSLKQKFKINDRIKIYYKGKNKKGYDSYGYKGRVS